MRRIPAIVLCLLMLSLCACSSAGSGDQTDAEISVAADSGSTVTDERATEPTDTEPTATELTLDMEQAVRDLDEYCGLFPRSYRMSSEDLPDQNIVYDFTGDGYDDLITGYMSGSGIIVDHIVVYDVANQVFYKLGDPEASYSISSFEDGCLTAVEYIYPDTYYSGTVEFVNNELVFTRIAPCSARTYAFVTP